MRGVKAAVVLAIIALAAVLGVSQALSRADAKSTVRVTETEMKISASPRHVPAGEVALVVTNRGSIDHELVVVRSNGSTSLPVKHFKADEGNRVVDEVELKAGETGRLTMNLSPGKYILICNVLGHYQLGMHTLLTAR